MRVYRNISLQRTAKLLKMVIFVELILKPQPYNLKNSVLRSTQVKIDLC